MSEDPRAKEVRTKSGKHPAVKSYRRKIDSIAEGPLADLEKLDEELKAFIHEIESERPPPMPKT
jgi:hypothetical protein